MPAAGGGSGPSPLAWRVVLPPIVLLAILLVATSGGYGYERDELYFRMLPLAWGYQDQPPLVPALAHLMALIDPSLTVLRLPSVLFAAATVVVGVLVTCELGGDRRAQGIAAWSIAFSGAPLTFAHTLLTATPDLLLWLTALLFATRALLRNPRWWLAAGAAVGLATYVKFLVVLLIAAVFVAILIGGPRGALRSRWLGLGIVVALVVGSPNLIWQAAHDWPQVTMTGAISSDKGGSDRVLLLPFQLLIVGPPLVPVWVAGFVALLRRPAWRPVRALAIAYPVLLVLVLATGGQIYYPLGLLLFLVAAGAVPVGDWTRRTRSRTRLGWVVAAVALTVVVSSVIALPLVPVSAVGATPIPAMNQAVRDQVGWPQYVAEVRTAYRTVPAASRPHTIVLTSNYGEAGAVAKYGRDLPNVYSGHNALYFVARPPASATTVVAVGFGRSFLQARFSTCRRAGALDNRVGVDNEEQGDPIEVCTGPRRPWPQLWPEFRHND
jgi:4-amino-4-deoxy-L-arabinose transferase-like glycosyltransferase